MKTMICLNMIVKDESDVIERCLASVKKWIDYWVIVDTGSSDGTQEIIRSFFKDIPGELHESPWVDFAYNRNVALALARNHGDYLLLIDADETLKYKDSFQWPLLDKDVYFGIQTFANTIYHRFFLIKNDADWRWVGVLHETLSCELPKSIGRIENISSIANRGGSRSKDPNKHLKDAAVLEKALLTEPNNSRYVFYLAISYGNAHEFSLAIKMHEKRIEMGGDPQEIFYSMLTIAEHQEALKTDPEIFINSYCRAFLFRPTRLEPLSYITRYYINVGCYLLGYLITKYALSQPTAFETIFVRYQVYEYELTLQFAECASQIGRTDECKAALHKLQENEPVSSKIRERIESIQRGYR